MKNTTFSNDWMVSAVLMGSMLTTSPTWSGEPGVTFAQPPNGEKNTVYVPVGLTQAELDDRLKIQTEKLKTMIEEAPAKTHALPPATKKQIDLMQEKIEALEKEANGYSWLDWLAIVAGLVTGGAAYAQYRNYINQRNFLDNFANRADATGEEITDGLRYENAMSQISNTYDLLARGEESSRRIDNFPYAYPYFIHRLPDAKQQLILLIPFFTLEILGNPKGVRDFHRALFEHFNAASNGKDGLDLTIITYDRKSRVDLARKRYSHAIHALKLLNNKPQVDALLEIFNKETADRLKKEIKDFQKAVHTVETRKQIYDLANEQLVWEAKRREESSGANDIEASDDDFYKRLSGGKKTLFGHVRDIRLALDKAVAEQEEIFFDKNRTGDNLGTPWPRGADIIEINRDSLLVNGEMPENGLGFDKKMTMFFDGQEATTGYAYQGPGDPYNNKVVRGVGKDILGINKFELENLLKNGNQYKSNKKVLITLQNLMQNSTAHQSREYIRLGQALEELKEIKEWFGIPTNEPP